MKQYAAILMVLLVCLPFRGLGQGSPPQDQQDERVTIDRNEVLIDAVVKDKKGRAIRDLTAADFEVYEDGVRQQVESFRLVTLGEESSRDTAPPANAGGSQIKKTPTRAVKSDVAGVAAVALVFDRLSPDARARARTAALNYLGKEQTGSDFIGVFAVDLSLHVVQPFTTDRQLIRAAIERAASASSASFSSTTEQVRKLSSRQEALEAADSNPGTSGVDGGSIAERAFNQMTIRALETFERMERDQQGYATTNGLLAIINSMRRIEGRKAMIFFSEGLAIPPAVQAFFRAVISDANRANVSVYAVDAAGLRIDGTTAETQREVTAIGARRRQQGSTGLDDTSGQPMSRVMERNEDVLRINPESGLGQLADQTGGFLVSQTNDPGAKLRQVNEDLHTYYALTYVSTNQNYDGRFRVLDVKLRRSDVEVQARKGYYGINAGFASPVLAYEVPALAAMGKSPRASSFPVYVGGFNFPDVANPDSVSVMVEVPAGVVTYSADNEKNAYRTDFSVVAVVKDEAQQVVRKLSRQYLLSGPLSDLERAKRGEILFYREASLPPGQYTVTAAAYDAISGKASVSSGTFEVRSADSANLRLSSLVLLKRAEKLVPEIKKVNNPFQYGEILVYPNLGEPLNKSTDKQLAFFLTAWASRSGTTPLKLSIEIRQGRTLSRALIDLPPADSSGRIQYANAVPLDKIQPGKYELTAIVSDGVNSVTRSRQFTLN